MGIDFFAVVIKGATEYPMKVDKKEFGIRDGKGGEPACVEEKPSQASICQCVVKNNTGNSLFFKPLDRLVEAKDAGGKDISICDAMLFAESHLCFLELKDSSKYSDARKKGVKQLVSTIMLFNRNHPQRHFHHRLAVVANRRRPYFNMANMSAMEDFKKKTGCILKFDATITFMP